MNTENNKLIAEFMDYHYRDEVNYEGWYKEKEFINRIGNTDVLKFHSDWNWLMEVVEKIERLGFTVEKNFQPIDNDWQCLVVKGNDILFQEFNEQSIQAMHYVVSEFIEWYNLNNLKNS